MAYRRYYRRYYRKSSLGLIPAAIILGALYVSLKISPDALPENLLKQMAYLALAFTALVAILILSIFAWKSYRTSRRYRALQLAQIDTMDPFEFEHYLKHLLEFRGYTNKKSLKPKVILGPI